MGFTRRRGVGMVIEGRRCDIDHFELLLQIIEVDLGLPQAKQTGPWIKPPRQRPSAPLAPLPSSPDVIVIEEEPEADGEPDIQVPEVLEATTAQPQPTRPETLCQEGLPEVSITF